MLNLKVLSDKELKSLAGAIKRELKSRRKAKNPTPKLRVYKLYVLLLTGNKYYVGITAQKVESRYQQHVNGTGAKWTKLHKPLGILETTKLGYMSESEATKYENKKTRELINEHGTKNVRGGDLCIVADQAIIKRYKEVQEQATKARDERIYQEILVNLNY